MYTYAYVYIHDTRQTGRRIASTSSTRHIKAARVIHTHKYACTHSSQPTRVHIYVHTNTYIHMYSSRHIYIYIYTYFHIHTSQQVNWQTLCLWMSCTTQYSSTCRTYTQLHMHTLISTHTHQFSSYQPTRMKIHIQIHTYVYIHDNR